MQTALVKSIIISFTIILPMIVVRAGNFDNVLFNFINHNRTIATVFFVLPAAFLTLKWIVNLVWNEENNNFDLDSSE